MTRESVISAAKPFIEEGVTSPDELLDSGDPKVRQLREAYDDRVDQELQRIPDLTLEERVRASIAVDSIWYDAGFTDINTLEEIEIKEALHNELDKFRRLPSAVLGYGDPGQEPEINLHNFAKYILTFPKKVNKAVSFNAIKEQAFELFYSKQPNGQRLEQLTELFLSIPTFVRKG